jgi:hypothetical protein
MPVWNLLGEIYAALKKEEKMLKPRQRIVSAQNNLLMKDGQPLLVARLSFSSIIHLLSQSAGSTTILARTGFNSI